MMILTSRAQVLWESLGLFLLEECEVNRVASEHSLAISIMRFSHGADGVAKRRTQVGRTRFDYLGRSGCLTGISGARSRILHVSTIWIGRVVNWRG